MTWLERIKRLERRNRRMAMRRNVRAYRLRQIRAGVRRIDVALTAEQHAILCAAKLPDESISATLGRLITSISGNSSQPENDQ